MLAAGCDGLPGGRVPGVRVSAPGWTGDVRAQVPKYPADACWRKLLCGNRFLPRTPLIPGESASQAQLGVNRDQHPGPPLRASGVAGFGGGPAQGLLEHAEGVLDIEPAQERLPEQIDGAGVQPGARRNPPAWNDRARPSLFARAPS